MSRASDELERLSYEAWSDLAGDATRTGGRFGKVVVRYARENPITVVVGGALLAAMVVSRMKREPEVVVERESNAPNRSQITSTISGMLKMWLVETLTSSLTPHVEEESVTR